jgi:3-methyladenine DNA glycosylase/8-oxoguanine DNA glycosylase
MIRLTLPAQPPFSLSAVVSSHGWAQLLPFGIDSRSGELSRVERLQTGRVIEMQVDELSDAVSVDVPGPLDEVERQEVVRKTGWMLELDRDLSSFYDLARNEPKLAHVEAQAKGRILRSPTLFEDVVKTILTTNTRWSGTIRMVEALVSQFGSPLPRDSTRHAFPTPEQLADTNAQMLRSAARLGYRAPYVVALARDVASGTLDLEGLRVADIPTTELRKRLLAIKGVGDYAAASVLMLLGRYDFVPVDSWALSMVSREWYGGEPIERAEVEARFEHWGMWKGLVYWFWDWAET